jgi:hypothetical protein
LGATRVDAEATPALGLALQNTEHINAFFDPPLAGSPFAGVGPADVHCRAPRETPLLAEGSERLGDGVLGIGTNAAVVFCALAPWQFDDRSNAGLRRTYRRTAFLATRLMANLGAQAATPLAKYWSTPAAAGEPGRWLQSFYLDEPEEWDDPYRFFRW